MIENITAIQGMPIIAPTLSYIDDYIKKTEYECFAKQSISKEDVLALYLLYSYREQFDNIELGPQTKTNSKWDERRISFRQMMAEEGII